MSTGKILKTELFENDDVTIITWYPWPSFLQTQIQNGRWLLRRSVAGNIWCFFREKPPFLISSCVVWTDPQTKFCLFLTCILFCRCKESTHLQEFSLSLTEPSSCEYVLRVRPWLTLLKGTWTRGKQITRQIDNFECSCFCSVRSCVSLHVCSN